MSGVCLVFDIWCKFVSGVCLLSVMCAVSGLCVGVCGKNLLTCVLNKTHNCGPQVRRVQDPQILNGKIWNQKILFLRMPDFVNPKNPIVKFCAHFCRGCGNPIIW